MVEEITLPASYSQLSSYQRKKVRERYIEIQNGNCFYCLESLAEEPPEHITSKNIKWQYFPDNFLKHPVHLQHNHATDKTEGAVHAYCNAVMWQYEKR